MSALHPSPAAVQTESTAPAARAGVLACIAAAAVHFERPSSPLSIKAGLALDEQGDLPFHQIEAALEQIGLRGEPHRRPLRRWAKADLPAILRLAGDRAVLVMDLADDDMLVDLTQGAGTVWVKRAAIAAAYVGQGISVRFDPSRERAAERPWQATAPRHWFWSEWRKLGGTFGHVALAAVLINLLSLALPLFTMNVYDRIIPNSAVASLWVLTLGVALALGLEFTLRLARAQLIDETGRELDARLSQKLFEKVMNIPLAAKAGSTGALARRVSEYELVRDFFASTTLVLAVDLFFVVLFVAVIALLAGWLALVPLVAVAIMAIAGISLRNGMAEAAVAAQADAGLQHSVLIESIGGAETLKACCGEGRMLGRWRRYAQASARTQETLRRLSAVAVNLATLCQQGTSIALVVGGFYLFNAGSISMGTIIAIVMLAGRSLAPVGQLAHLVMRGRQALLTMRSLQKLMELDDERALAGRSIVPEIRQGTVRLENLCFAYPNGGADALHDISLSISPGERVGLIGRVASGKSTLGRVLCGLHAPTGGSQLIDGIDSRQHHPHALRAAFRFVGQDAELFSGTIRDNLLLGAREQDDARLVAALQRSGAASFLSRDAAGFDLHVGERGSRLSGGQRSFLVLARALVEPCRLLFLDEPTGAMDVQTERIFIEHLRSALATDQTLVVSTHRHAMLELVDRLIVIDRGSIIADGPRDQVLSALQSSAGREGEAVVRTGAS